MRAVAVAVMGWLSCVLATGCGGRVETTSESGEDPPSSKPTAPTGDDPADASDSPAADGINLIPDTELGACELGELAWKQVDDCAWVADNRCYSTRTMACNCACPRRRNSQCLSGFDAGVNGRVWVACD